MRPKAPGIKAAPSMLKASQRKKILFWAKYGRNETIQKRLRVTTSKTIIDVVNHQPKPTYTSLTSLKLATHVLLFGVTPAKRWGNQIEHAYRSAHQEVKNVQHLTSCPSSISSGSVALVVWTSLAPENNLKKEHPSAIAKPQQNAKNGIMRKTRLPKGCYSQPEIGAKASHHAKEHSRSSTWRELAPMLSTSLIFASHNTDYHKSFMVRSGTQEKKSLCIRKQLPFLTKQPAPKSLDVDLAAFL